MQTMLLIRLWEKELDRHLQRREDDAQTASRSNAHSNNVGADGLHGLGEDGAPTPASQVLVGD
jgi:hypothetical protein